MDGWFCICHVDMSDVHAVRALVVGDPFMCFYEACLDHVCVIVGALLGSLATRKRMDQSRDRHQGRHKHSVRWGLTFPPYGVVRLLIRTALVRLSGYLSVACDRFFVSVCCMAVCYKAVRLVRHHVSRSLRLPRSSSPACPSLFVGVRLSDFKCSIHESVYGMDESHPDAVL